MKTTTVRMRGGCFECHGDKAHWTAKNAAGVVARHHDTTGHETWVVVQITTVNSETTPKRKTKGFISDE